MCLSILRNGSSRGGNIRKILRRGRCICRSPRRAPFGLGSRTPRMGTQDRILNLHGSGLVVLHDGLRPPPSSLRFPPSPTSHPNPPLLCFDTIRASASRLLWLSPLVRGISTFHPTLGYIPSPSHTASLNTPTPSYLFPSFRIFTPDMLFIGLYFLRTYSCCLFTYRHINEMLFTIYWEGIAHLQQILDNSHQHRKDLSNN